ncbi:hypothetical protein QYF61_018944 [Mycteria americana]|uniref:Uncharacterized protein n=1 Tax=Mycteria americana TaxID=33587 RepID=A0AAN7NVM9_MYCAM|nr:hypothetical protein QYF61_018944 [Mycteria americana]
MSQQYAATATKANWILAASPGALLAERDVIIPLYSPLHGEEEGDSVTDLEQSPSSEIQRGTTSKKQDPCLIQEMREDPESVEHVKGHEAMVAPAKGRATQTTSEVAVAAVHHQRHRDCMSATSFANLDPDSPTGTKSSSYWGTTFNGSLSCDSLYRTTSSPDNSGWKGPQEVSSPTFCSEQGTGEAAATSPPKATSFSKLNKPSSLSISSKGKCSSPNQLRGPLLNSL